MWSLCKRIRILEYNSSVLIVYKHLLSLRKDNLDFKGIAYQCRAFLFDWAEEDERRM